MNTEDKLREMMSAARVEETVTHAEWTSFVGRAHRPLYLRRAALAVGTLAVIGLGAFAASSFLADDPTVAPLPPAGTPTAPAEPSPTSGEQEVAEESPSEHERELWFVEGELLSRWSSYLEEIGGPGYTGRDESDEVAGDDPVAQEAAFWLELLVAGPGEPHPGATKVQEPGDTTAIPEGTALLGVARRGNTLEVDLSSEFESGGGSLSMQLRVAQIVYTGTQFDGIDSVRILIEGERVDAIGGEGVPAEGRRRDFQNVAPAIVVETPKPGDEISSPVTISGFANVFEANVNIRISDANGDILVETFTTATCGSGCWGDFSEDVEFEVSEAQEGRVEVLTYSAEDGSERDVISIPVLLIP